jgi:transcriptional regulator with XRE-family HTH domain
MILADKITELRKKEGWSQEELADKLGVSRQSVSKWESAQSVPDMNRVIALAQLFGVSTDYLLIDSLEEPSDGSSAGNADAVIYEDSSCALDTVRVSMEEANALLAHKNYSSGRIALGVMLCIMSPCLLIALEGACETGRISLSGNQTTGLGLIILFSMIASAVALFVTTGLRGSRFEYLENSILDTAYGVDGMVNERMERFRREHDRMLSIGIVLCVAAVIAIFAGILFFGEEEFAMSVAVAVMLALIAVGVFLIVKCSIIWGGFKMLLQQDDYSPAEKLESKRMGPFASIYWCAVTAVFLGWSFITNSWDRTWIIWPVAGVAFGMFAGIMKMLRKRG